MNYPLRFPDQLKPHLRALRKSQGLTQAQLGTLVGVKQARIAEIEANPGSVSLDQLTKVLAALGAALHLHAVEGRTPADQPAPHTPNRRRASTASTSNAAGPVARSARVTKPPLAPAHKQRTTAKPVAPRAGVVISGKKGTW